LIEREPLHRLIIEMGNDVICHDSGFRRRCFVDWGDDLDRAILHGHFDADASKLAADLHLHFAEGPCGIPNTG
jgi:hypothetical protein